MSSDFPRPQLTMGPNLVSTLVIHWSLGAISNPSTASDCGRNASVDPTAEMGMERRRGGELRGAMPPS